MDAKAKVVAWLCTAPDGYGIDATASLATRMDYERSGRYITPLIPLTDHEAAMAAERERVERLSHETVDLMFEAAEATVAMEAAKRQLTTLLTGLEALAGEMRDDMEIFKGGVEGSWYRWRYDTFAVMEERIRTLASSATGEKNTEEEIK